VIASVKYNVEMSINCVYMPPLYTAIEREGCQISDARTHSKACVTTECWICYRKSICETGRWRKQFCPLISYHASQASCCIPSHKPQCKL